MKPQENIYLGLFLKEEEGVCFLFEMNNQSLRILNKEKFNYTNGWENIAEDIDEILYRLEKQLKKNIEKTIFFVYSHMVDEKTGEIIQPYLSKIKELTKNLELKPIGYIECHEAIISHIEKKEQLPLTGILLELDKNYVDLFIYKGGHKICFQKISRTNRITDDLESALLTINKNTLLPSRIIIYNSVNLSDLSSEIISYRWKPEIFIQTPRVEIVGEQDIYVALAGLFNSQLLENKDERRDEKKDDSKEQVMGFVIGGEAPLYQEKPLEAKPSFFKKIKEGFRFPQLKFNLKLPKISLSYSIIIGFTLIILSYLAGEIFLHKADVTIFVPTKEIKKEVAINSSMINIYLATKSADIKKTIATTGKKEIGDLAKGEITIHNFDDKEKTFAKGTVITTGGLQFTLDNDTTVASSSLAVDGSAKLPGKTKAKVTASAIGTASNLGKNQRFTIADLPTSLYFAINEAEFTGGTEQAIKTVAKTDLETLQTLVLAEGKKTLENQNSSFTKTKEKAIIPLTENKISSTVFSKEVGEEADQVDLQAKIVSSYYAFREPDLINYLITEIKKITPVGYLVNANRLSYKIETADKTQDKVDLKIQVDVKAIKDISAQDIIKQIAGKNIKQLSPIIKNGFHATGFDFTVKPDFFLYKNQIPFWRNNINLKISSL